MIIRTFKSIGGRVMVWVIDTDKQTITVRTLPLKHVEMF
jgi:hypothetical protein